MVPGPVSTKRKIPTRVPTAKSKVVAQSPVAAYIRGKTKTPQLNGKESNATFLTI